MLHAMCEEIVLFLSVVFCSASVKLLDDFLDREIDAVTGAHNWINRLGEDAVVYSLPLLVAGVAMRPAIGAALFLASWAIGMFHHFGAKYPSGLFGWQEVIGSIACGVFVSGLRAMAFALLLTLAVQLIDDIIDRHADRATGMRNLALRWGGLQCSIACTVCCLSAWLLIGNTFWPVVGGIVTVYAASTQGGRCLHD